MGEDELAIEMRKGSTGVLYAYSKELEIKWEFHSRDLSCSYFKVLPA